VRATADPAVAFSDAPVSSSALETTAQLVETPAVAREAAKELGRPGGDPEELLDVVEVESVPPVAGGESDLLSLVATADSAEEAAARANAFARAVNNVRSREAIEDLEAAIAALEDQEEELGGDSAARTELATQLQSLRAARAAASTNVETIEPALEPDSPVAPNPIRNTALAALLSLLLGLGAVALAERLDRRLRKPEELEPLVGAPLLSVIPESAFPGKAPHPHAIEEAFGSLRASLTYFNIDRPLGTVMVTSPTRGDGKTTVATYLGIALARDGRDAIVLDCDLRRPQVATRLGVEGRIGLAQVLVGEATLDEALIEVDVGDGRLRVLPAGSSPPNPARLVGSERMRSLLAEMAEISDLVVIDTPPILTVSDAVPLLERVSGTILVACLDQTSRDALERLNRVIETAKGSVLGVVATGAKAGGLYGYGYYGYGYYGKGYEPDATQASGRSSNGSKSPRGLRKALPLPRPRRGSDAVHEDAGLVKREEAAEIVEKARELEPAEPLAANEDGNESTGEERQHAAAAAAQPSNRGDVETTSAISLNHGTFEDFRALGLSNTQARRLLAYRDQVGEFRSVEELDEVPGFSAKTRAELKAKVTVS